MFLWAHTEELQKHDYKLHQLLVLYDGLTCYISQIAYIMFI